MEDEDAVKKRMDEGNVSPLGVSNFCNGYNINTEQD